MINNRRLADGSSVTFGALMTHSAELGADRVGIRAAAFGGAER